MQQSRSRRRPRSTARSFDPVHRLFVVNNHSKLESGQFFTGLANTALARLVNIRARERARTPLHSGRLIGTRTERRRVDRSAQVWNRRWNRKYFATHLYFAPRRYNRWLPATQTPGHWVDLSVDPCGTPSSSSELRLRLQTKQNPPPSLEGESNCYRERYTDRNAHGFFIRLCFSIFRGETSWPVGTVGEEGWRGESHVAEVNFCVA